MSRGNPDLDKLQRWFLATITHPAGIAAGVDSPEARRHLPVEQAALDAVITRSDRQSAAERLAVYSSAYFARLLSVLGELFPCTRFAVGDALFDELAVGYLHKHPPAGYTLARLADKLVDHLDFTRPSDWGAFVVELARLEQAIDRIFDGPGPEQLPPLAVPPTSGDSVRLRLVPGAELHAFAHPVSTYYSAWKAGERPDWPQPRGEYVALFRRDFVVRRYPLSVRQYELLLSLSRGVTLAESLANAALASDCPVDVLARDVSEWFTFWAQERFFATLE